MTWTEVLQGMVLGVFFIGCVLAGAWLEFKIVRRSR